MAKLIGLPDGSTGEFPDDMADGDIVDVISKQFPGNRSSDIPAVRQKESRGSQNAYNAASGAAGDMQVRNATNTDPGYGVRPAQDDSPAERSRVGEDYISALQGKYGRAGGLMAYNWGPGKYEKWQAAGADPTKVPVETQDYVRSITGKPISEHFAQQSGPYTGPSATGYRKDDADAPPFRVEVRGVGSTGTTPQGEQTEPQTGGQPPYDGPDAQTVRDMSSDQPSLRDTITDVASRFGEGVAGDLKRIGQRIIPEVAANPLLPEGLSPHSMDAERAAYEAKLPSLGTAGAIGDVTPELLLSGGSINAAGNALSKLPLAMKVFGRAAPFVADAAANSGASAAMAESRGEDPLEAAMYGAGGAAGARVLTRALGGVTKPFLSTEAKLLLKDGVYPTPGNLMDGVPGRITNAAEELASKIGGPGNIIDYSRNSARRQYLAAETRATMKPINSNASRLPNAMAARDAAYAAAKERTSLNPAKAHAAIDYALEDARSVPMLTKAQHEQLGTYLRDKINRLSPTGATISGKAAKEELDSELTRLSQQYWRSSNASDKPLGVALRRAQTALRRALDGDTAAMTAANETHGALAPLERAGAGATPEQVGNQMGSKQTDLNKAAQVALPAGSGAVGHGFQVVTALHAMVHPAGKVATVATALLYSKPGVNLLVHGLGALLPKETRAYIATLPPERAVMYLDELANRFPHLIPGMQQAVAQLGRAAAQIVQQQQQQPEMQP